MLKADVNYGSVLILKRSHKTSTTENTLVRGMWSEGEEVSGDGCSGNTEEEWGAVPVWSGPRPDDLMLLRRCGTLDLLIVNRKWSTCDGSVLLSTGRVSGEEQNGSGTGSEKTEETNEVNLRPSQRAHASQIVSLRRSDGV